MPLTDIVLRNAKPRDADYKLADGGGLYLLVRPNGSRLWNQAYRYAGKQKKLAIGPYPGVTLVGRREARRASEPRSCCATAPTRPARRSSPGWPGRSPRRTALRS